MARSLRQLPALLQDDIDIVLEARDARVPLSGVNTGLAGMVRQSWGGDGVEDTARAGWGATGTVSWATRRPATEEIGKGRMRERVVVYTKRDLAEPEFEEPLKRAFWKHAKQRVFFANTTKDKDIKTILQHLVDLARRHAEITGNPEAQTNILVVGMPNVGKSSFLNALRRVGVHKGKAFQTSSQPGHTRKLTGTVRVHSDPNIYVYDTPGVMMPYLGKGAFGAEKGLKLALTGGIKGGLFSEETVAEYLLYLLNTHHYTCSPTPVPRDTTYLARLGLVEGKQSLDKNQTAHVADAINLPTDSLHAFLTALARRLGTLRKGGEPDVDAAQKHFLQSYREGKLGPLTVDDLGRGLMTLESDEAASEIAQLREIDSGSRSPPANPADDRDTTVYAAVRSFLLEEERRLDHGETSITQQRKKDVARVKAERRERNAKMGFGAGKAWKKGAKRWPTRHG